MAEFSNVRWIKNGLNWNGSARLSIKIPLKLSRSKNRQHAHFRSAGLWDAATEKRCTFFNNVFWLVWAWPLSTFECLAVCAELIQVTQLTEPVVDNAGVIRWKVVFNREIVLNREIVSNRKIVLNQEISSLKRLFTILERSFARKFRRNSILIGYNNCLSQ